MCRRVVFPALSLDIEFSRRPELRNEEYIQAEEEEFGMLKMVCQYGVGGMTITRTLLSSPNDASTS
jgi:hypothetical protein